MTNGQKVASALADSKGTETTQQAVQKTCGAGDGKRYDRQLDQATWPTSTPPPPIGNGFKTIYKHDSMKGAKE